MTQANWTDDRVEQLKNSLDRGTLGKPDRPRARAV